VCYFAHFLDICKHNGTDTSEPGDWGSGTVGHNLLQLVAPKRAVGLLALKKSPSCAVCQLMPRSSSLVLDDYWENFLQVPNVFGGFRCIHSLFPEALYSVHQLFFAPWFYDDAQKMLQFMPE